MLEKSWHVFRYKLAKHAFDRSMHSFTDE
ncbi:MAG: hypothetical protein ACJAZJ_000843 [Candidatus Endobugula sp.]